MTRVGQICFGWGLLLVFTLTGCTAAHYRKSADAAAYGAIKGKTPLVKDMDPDFTIEQTNTLHLENLPVVTNVADYLGTNEESAPCAVQLSLKAALKIAVQQSRDYQSHKENLYLAALDLSLARHQFTPIFSLGGQAAYNSAATQDATLSDHLVEENSVSASGSAG